MTARTPTGASRAIPTPIRSIPSSIPYEAMAVSQQTHIDDLVQKNRTLDHIAKKLKDELILEQTRSKEAAKAIKAQWQVESAEWREGCDSLQACHRIAHLRTVIELDKERLAVVKEKDVARRERIAILQRDYRITMFQVKESELEGKIADLEDEIEELRLQGEEDANALVMQHQEAVEKLRTKCAQFAGEATQKTSELAAMGKEKDRIEAQLSRLREEHAELVTSSASTTSKLERTTLQRDGAQTQIAELERLNDDFKRNNAELKRQLDKWQNLENKGGAEVETLRKRRIDLELQLKTCEGRLADAEKKDQELTKALEKEKKRVERLKESIDPWRDEVEDAKNLAARHESVAIDIRKQLSKAEKQIEKLKAQVETERKKAKASKQVPVPSDDELSQVESGQEALSEDEVEKEVAKAPLSPPQPATKARPKPRPAYKNRKEAPSDNVEAGISEKAKGKRKARDESDVEVVAEKKGRRKAAVEEDPPAKLSSRGAGKSENEIVETRPKRAKPASRAESKPAFAVDEAVDDESAPKKKKRKINIFPAAQPTSFPWGQLPQGDSGLNIPTELSPVKDDEVLSQSIIGRMSSILSFGSR